nr:roadblock/LC7 domain-containing protein [Kineococcus vitellinus]
MKRDIPGVRRVLIARTDGLAFHDDGPESEHDAAAAVVATVLGIAERAADTAGLGAFSSTTVKGADGTLVVHAVDTSHLLAVVADPQVNLVLLDRLARRLVAELAGAEAGVPSPRR